MLAENKPTTSNKLAVIDGENLMEKRLAPTKFYVETLLPQGLCILAGAPKIGKSWLVLDLCVKVAKGEPFLSQPTMKGTGLYLCLEDSLRRIQDLLGITILLVHHLRKMEDSDPLSKISGSTGITGAADAAYVLDKSRRNADTATLCCAGRDRGLELKLGKEIYTWEVIQGSLETPEMLLPDTIVRVMEFIMKIRSYSESNAEFTERFCEFANMTISAKALKQQMNRYRYKMEEKHTLRLRHELTQHRM